MRCHCLLCLGFARANEIRMLGDGSENFCFNLILTKSPNDSQTHDI